MSNRYIVHGRDHSSGQVVQKTIEAASAREAEETAAKLGMTVVGSEIAPDAPASPAPARMPGGGAPMADVPEELVWAGSPSQWTNFWWYAACLLVIPIPFAVWNYITTKAMRYTLTNQRLKLEWGVFSKSVEEVELYRVTDTAVRQTFTQRLLSIGDVWLETSDARNKEVTLRSVPKPQSLRESVRQNAERRRRWRRVAEVEVS